MRILLENSGFLHKNYYVKQSSSIQNRGGAIALKIVLHLIIEYLKIFI
jgi:hypothetical protein